MDFEKWVCPGTTDARFIREVIFIIRIIFTILSSNHNLIECVSFQLNLPALGFMPMPNTPTKLHDHDEFIHADVYLNGINIYKKIIANLANA